MISWKTIGFGLLMVIVVISVIPSAFAQTLLQITSPLSRLPGAQDNAGAPLIRVLCE